MWLRFESYSRSNRLQKGQIGEKIAIGEKMSIPIPEYLKFMMMDMMEEIRDMTGELHPSGAIAIAAAATAGIILLSVPVILLKRWRARASIPNVHVDEGTTALSSIHFYSGSTPNVFNNTQCIGLLKKYPEFVNKPMSEHPHISYGYTPFLRACWNNNFELIQFMLNAGADISINNHNSETPLYLVAYRVSKSKTWDPRALNLLWNAGCSIDDVNIHNNSMLHLAAKAGHVTLTRWLLLHGAEANVINRSGFTPRNLALRKGTRDHLIVANLLNSPEGEGVDRNFVVRSDGIQLIKRFSVSDRF